MNKLKKTLSQINKKHNEYQLIIKAIEHEKGVSNMLSIRLLKTKPHSITGKLAIISLYVYSLFK